MGQRGCWWVDLKESYSLFSWICTWGSGHWQRSWLRITKFLVANDTWFLAQWGPEKGLDPAGAPPPHPATPQEADFALWRTVVLSPRCAASAGCPRGAHRAGRGRQLRRKSPAGEAGRSRPPFTASWASEHFWDIKHLLSSSPENKCNFLPWRGSRPLVERWLREHGLLLSRRAANTLVSHVSLAPRRNSAAGEYLVGSWGCLLKQQEVF